MREDERIRLRTRMRGRNVQRNGLHHAFQLRIGNHVSGQLKEHFSPSGDGGWAYLDHGCDGPDGESLQCVFDKLLPFFRVFAAVQGGAGQLVKRLDLAMRVTASVPHPSVSVFRMNRDLTASAMRTPVAVAADQPEVFVPFPGQFGPESTVLLLFFRGVRHVFTHPFALNVQDSFLSV